MVEKLRETASYRPERQQFLANIAEGRRQKAEGIIVTLWAI
ncbi:MAG: hypothetical protein ACRC62_21065 [Microcoleus sp.]